MLKRTTPTMTNIHLCSRSFVEYTTRFDVSIKTDSEKRLPCLFIRYLITNKMLQRECKNVARRCNPNGHTLFSSSSCWFCPGMKDFVGLEEVMKFEFLLKLFAETLGTFLLVLIGCASCITWTADNPPTVVHIAFTFGLAVASLAHVSHVFDT